MRPQVLFAAACSGRPDGGKGRGDDTAPPDWPEDLVVLDHVRVADAAGVIEDAAVLVTGDTIHSVAAAGQDWPAGAEVHEYSGATVIPGLIDSHVHLFHSGSPAWVGDTLAANIEAYLAWGVVGVADVGAPEVVFDLRDRVAEGSIRGPRIWATGPMLTAVGSHPCETVNDDQLCRFVEGDGAEVVAALDRADGIKVVLADAGFTDWPTPRLDLGDLADVAAAAAVPVLAHVDEEDDALDALAQGVAVLAHPVFATDLVEAPDAPTHTTIGAFAGTSALFSGDLLADDLSHTPPEVVSVWEALSLHPEEFAEGWIEASEEWAAHARANVALAVDSGRTVIAGSDAGYWFVPHGLALHRELAELVLAGMSPIEALAAATSVPADLLGWDDLGWVAAGYRADLVVVDGRPDEDIADARRIAEVWMGGAPLGAGETWVEAGEGLCLDDRDCGGSRCDLVLHTCGEGCEPPYDLVGSCDEATWCMPADGLVATEEGVCHEGDSCDLYAQDCAPDWYGENCVPIDLDTNLCWQSGPREAGQTCSWVDPDLYCEQGVFCSWVDGHCYEMCDPDDASACTGCTRQQVEGNPWFGLCL